MSERTPDLNPVILSYMRTTLTLAGADRLIETLNEIPSEAARLAYAAQFGLQEKVNRGERPVRPEPVRTPTGPGRQMRFNL
jgi:hypothetical protein